MLPSRLSVSVSVVIAACLGLAAGAFLYNRIPTKPAADVELYPAEFTVPRNADRRALLSSVSETLASEEFLSACFAEWIELDGTLARLDLEGKVAFWAGYKASGLYVDLFVPTYRPLNENTKKNLSMVRVVTNRIAQRFPDLELHELYPKVQE